MMDNYDYFKEDDRRREEQLEAKPICACCGEHIQSEDMWNIDGWYCEDCKDIYLSNIRKNVCIWAEEQRGIW